MTRRVDPYLLARRAAVLERDTALSECERLLESLTDDDGAIHWRAAFAEQVDAAGRHQTMLDLQACGTLNVPCVRCLEALALPMDVAHSYQLVADEALAARLDDSIADQDVLAADQHFDLLSLIEDELIMALPLMPRHEDCPASAGLLPDGPVEAALPSEPADPETHGERQFPFAGLAGQMRRSGAAPTPDDARRSGDDHSDPASDEHGDE